MEDKQIYTSARSEEIKRQIIAFGKKVKKVIDTYQEGKKKARAKKLAENASEKLKKIPQTVNEKPQNIQIKADSFQNDKQTVRGLPRKEHFERIPEDTLYSMFVYLLFFIIVAIIALSIYLSYFKK